MTLRKMCRGVVRDGRLTQARCKAQAAKARGLMANGSASKIKLK